MKQKTWKREVALILQALFWYVVFTKEVNLVEALIYPVFTYTALAYGMEWASRSGVVLGKPTGPVDRGRPERSCECSSREDKHSDSGHYYSKREQNSETTGKRD